MQIVLKDLVEYNDDRFAVKSVFKGAQSEAILLMLNPNQELPAHPHERFEVVLVPQEGHGTMTVNGTKDVDLVPRTLYYEPAGSSIRIVNTGDIPLQVLITLIRVERT